MKPTSTSTARPPHVVSWGFLALFLLVNVATTWLLLHVLPRAPFDAVVRATGGLVSHTLLNYLPSFVIGVGVLLFAIGRQRPRDLGLRAAQLAPAAAWAAGLWLYVLIVQSAIGLARDGALTLHPDWLSHPATVGIGVLLGQLLGNALYEEIVYRAFWLRQLRAKLPLGRPDGAARWAVAILVSQAIFAAVHIPHRLRYGVTGTELLLDLAGVFGAGLFFVWLYMQTGNLFLAVGVHALGNYPTGLVVEEVPSQALVYATAIAALVAQALLRRARRRRSAGPRVPRSDP